MTDSGELNEQTKENMYNLYKDSETFYYLSNRVYEGLYGLMVKRTYDFSASPRILLLTPRKASLVMTRFTG